MTPVLRSLALLLGSGIVLLLAVHATSGQERQRDLKGKKMTPEQYEERIVNDLAKRVVRSTDREVHRWHKELVRLYPGEIGKGVTRDDVKTWFDVLAGGRPQWRRSTTDMKLAALFDRVVSELELGPVRSITRNEFDRFARRELRASSGPDEEDYTEDAKRAFRVLDQNEDGELDWKECPPKLRTALKGDPDSNGRIILEEYREYFDARVAEAVVVTAKLRAAEAAKKDKPDEDEDDLPPWFAEFDLDEDGQVSLYEWRKCVQPVDEFQEMDLNEDGLLPPEEYKRYVRKVELKQDDDDDDDDDDPPSHPR
ncbi:MAG: EF-hand domain-containing protein [Planctomycetia bacterium]|nr:EF-hand domain-containing protein [Planctomycetia bacterium]